MITLRIEQGPPQDGKYLITLRHLVDGTQKRTAQATIEFALTDQEQEELRWYLEDYLPKASVTASVIIEQITTMIRQRGVELYQKVFTANANTQALWFALRDHLANLRVEITTGIAEAASIPWELMRDPELDSPIALRLKAFVRVQSDPRLSFVEVAPLGDNEQLRLLLVICRPDGGQDILLRASANRILRDLKEDRDRFDITVLRPPTFEALQAELGRAKSAGRPYHILHFDGHGMYADLNDYGSLSQWRGNWSPSKRAASAPAPLPGKQGYLCFEHPGSDGNIRPVNGQELGQMCHDHQIPVVILEACQTAMHEATESPPPADVEHIHDSVRAIGSLAQAMTDEGIPAVLGMRYNVYVATSAQYIGELYRALAQGQTFGEAASTGRKHLFHNPERWLGLQPHTLQDWCVPVVHEAMPISLLPPGKGGLNLNTGDEERDPVLASKVLRRYTPPGGFIGRDETLLALDRAFDTHRLVLLHAYAGQGKSSTAVEFARWYALTGGLGPQPVVLLSSFEQHLDLASLLNQVATSFASELETENILWHAINEPEKRRSLVIKLLRRKPILWIWDNVEPIAGFPAGTPSQWPTAEQEDLRDFLHQIAIDTRSQVKLLLTSRRDEQAWLGALPHRIKMPRMSAADAALLAQQLGAERKITRDEVADWQPLLDYCAGNPLTLRVLVGQALRERLHGAERIRLFTEAIRSGEQAIQDTDATQGRDRSLGASLDYGFKHAFQDDELPIIALLHLFQGTVMVNVIEMMGKEDEHALPEVQGRSKEEISALLRRACGTGLLTHRQATWFTIHPALPWFVSQLFARHYDGQAGRSSALAAKRAWVEVVGKVANFYHDQLIDGQSGVIVLLELEESNFLAARRFARRQQWWQSVISTMQGLHALYDHQGRHAEWARLVTEIVPDYCLAEDEPLAGREDEYSVVMEYRVKLAKDVERDQARAQVMQEKLVAHNRVLAKEALALPVDSEMPSALRNKARTLAISLITLGQLQREAKEAACVDSFQQSGNLLGRIGDRAAQSVAEFNLGHAYKDVPSLRDLTAASAAYQRSLELHVLGDALGRSKCLQQIAIVHHERLREALNAKGAAEILLKHANAALQGYGEALELCPASSLVDRGPMHTALGALHGDIGEWDEAREQYTQAIQCHEATGNRYNAGLTRTNMTIMYRRASEHQPQAGAQRDFLLRAQAYAEAALRDFQHYQGRAAAEEAKVQRLLDIIAQKLQA